MKNALLLTTILMVVVLSTSAQEYKVVTTVESVVQMGLGRSRIIETTDSLEAKDFTTSRTDGKKINKKM